jgi:hypothetical protein
MTNLKQTRATSPANSSFLFYKPKMMAGAFVWIFNHNTCRASRLLLTDGRPEHPISSAIVKVSPLPDAQYGSKMNRSFSSIWCNAARLKPFTKISKHLGRFDMNESRRSIEKDPHVIITR